MEPRKRPIRRKGEPMPQGFEVTREEVIGFVSFGAGEDSPLVVAFSLIADVVDRDGNGGRFRFPGPHEDSTVTVSVEIG